MTLALFGRSGFLGSALDKHCTGKPDFNSDVWINAMARVMGIVGNSENQAYLLMENLKSAITVFDLAQIYKCRRIVNFGSTCAYSPDSDVPFDPRVYTKGEPEKTNYGYAVAKRTIYELSRLHNQQYNMDNLYLVLPNLYGPGCPFGESNHVIPDMILKIQKAIDSKAEEVTFFGSGKPEREFLYIDDAVQVILEAIGAVYTSDPVNVGGSPPVTICTLAEMLCAEMGYSGKIVWDTTQPDGQLKRQLKADVKPATVTPLEAGLKQTVNYFRALQTQK